MAANTKQLKHDGIYYYGGDLYSASGPIDDNKGSPSNTQDTAYYDGIAGPPPADVTANPLRAQDPDTSYYDGIPGAAVSSPLSKAKPHSYQNVGRTFTPPGKSSFPSPKIKHQPLPVPPLPPTVKHSGPKPSESTVYNNDIVETSFGQKPTYDNTNDQSKQSEASDTQYERLDQDTRQVTSGNYAELK